MRIPLLAVLCMALALSGASRAAAHAELVASEPPEGAIVATTPEQVALHFSEPVAPVSLRWFPPAGPPVEITPSVVGATLVAQAPAGLGQGTQLLSWRVVSADGHPVGGSLVFSLGAPSQVADGGRQAAHSAVAAATRGLLTLALVVGVGGAVFLSLVVRGPGTADAARRLALGAALAVPVAAVLALGAQGLDLAGVPLVAVFGPRPWAAALGAPLAATAAVASLAGLAAAVALLGPTGRWLAAIAWGFASISFALSGHAATAQPVALMAPAVALHAAGFIFWLGALPGLVVVTRAARADLGGLLARFSRLATPLVALLVASGVVLAAVQLETPAALIDTAYGRLLCAKLAAVLILMALAALNRFALTPAIRRGDPRAIRRLDRAVIAEICLGLLILGLASGFRLTTPPRSLHAGPGEVFVQLHGQTAMAAAVITPGRPGPNEIEIDLMSMSHAPLEPSAVSVAFADAERGRRADPSLGRGRPGRWRAGPVVLPLSGDWSLAVEVLISDFEQETLRATVRIADAPE